VTEPAGLTTVPRPEVRQRRLEELYAQHARAVFAYARRRASWADADEVVAETFLVAWRRLDDVPAEERAWLLGVARGALANRQRSDARQLRLQSRLALATPREEPAHEEAQEPVRRALAALPDRDREALTLLAWDGLTPAEIAVALGCSRSAAYVRIHRARRRFSALLTTPAAASAEGDET
jgi:RNA polymerase sigma-70 factor (ECF subfamily)